MILEPPPASDAKRSSPQRAEGAWIVTADGQRLLDFASGLDAPFGHGLLAADAPLALPAPLAEEAAARLAGRLSQISLADRVRLAASRETAAEMALCTMWRYQELRKRPKRRRIITFRGGWHGDAPLLDLATGGMGYQRSFEPLGDLFDRATFNDLASVQALVTTQTAGILVEPLQRRGTFELPQNGFLMGLRALADEYDLVLAFDESASGLGRTGPLWACEWAGAPSDLMILGANLAGGLPFGALLGIEKLAKAMEGGPGTTAAHPLAVAAAHVALDRLLSPGFLDAIESRGWALEEQLYWLARHHPAVIDRRYGMGLWQTLRTHVPAETVWQALRDHGLLALTGTDNHIALVPPLTVTDAELSAAMTALEAACAALVPVA
jgi:acetylornithine/N-succinyldiaminopimelate aminotransferase